MKEKLTATQEKTLNCIKSFINEKGYSPSVRELCKMVKKKSPATIKSTLDLLQKKGYIAFVPQRARTIRIIDEKRE